MSTPIIEVRNVVKTFPVRRGIILRRQVGEVRAVDDVSLELRRGETVGLVGESGSGKSTLARILVGIEKPTSGAVLVDGIDVTSMTSGDRRRLRRRVQMVFQDPSTSLNPRMTVGDIVGEAYRIHPDAAPAAGRAAGVGELLELVGLDPNHVNRYPHQFSGGQRQRLGIARALAVRPEVLICDEPVSALDVSVQGQVINLLDDLQAELGLAYLFIAHDLAVVRHIADEVAVMYLGGIVEHGAADAVYDRPTHPYTRALMAAVPTPDPTVRLADAEIVLEGDLPSPAAPPPGCRFHTRCWLAAQLGTQLAGDDRRSRDPAGDVDPAGNQDGGGVPTPCATQRPTLTALDEDHHPDGEHRTDEGRGHRVACHFAAVAATAVAIGAPPAATAAERERP